MDCTQKAVVYKKRQQVEVAICCWVELGDRTVCTSSSSHNEDSMLLDLSKFKHEREKLGSPEIPLPTNELIQQLSQLVTSTEHTQPADTSSYKASSDIISDLTVIARRYFTRHPHRDKTPVPNLKAMLDTELSTYFWLKDSILTPKFPLSLTFYTRVLRGKVESKQQMTDRGLQLTSMIEMVIFKFGEYVATIYHPGWHDKPFIVTPTAGEVGFCKPYTNITAIPVILQEDILYQWRGMKVTRAQLVEFGLSSRQIRRIVNDNNQG